MIFRNGLPLGLMLIVTSCSPITSCEKYASEFSCYYVTDMATYDVLYWQNVQADNPDDERVIGTVKGLQACKTMAEGYAAGINEEWNDRSYVCALLDDGGYAEKHRLLN
jgi:hypothetical protein